MPDSDAMPLPFDWDSLPRIDLGLDGHRTRPRTETWSLTLATGREIRLEALHQERTYRHVLSGAGFQHVGERIVRKAIARARSLFGWGDAAAVHVLPPRLLAYESNFGRPSDPPNICDFALLPPVCSMAEFRSDSPTRDADEAYSSLLVVWFQDAFGMPGDGPVTDSLRTLPWNDLAHNWTP